MHPTRSSRALAFGLTLWSGAQASASVFDENFEVDPTANWTVNTSNLTDSAANYFFDYSTVGIPAAPSGAGTRGMKLQANLTSGVFGGMSASPTGVDLSGDYTLTFDWWANVNGDFPVGGSGSTNLSTFGVGTAGTTAQWPGGTHDSAWFGATGDGNSSSDYRAYSSAGPTSYPDGDPVYEAATRNQNDPYYAGFGNMAAPAAQLALYPQQTGNTLVGAAGMEWHQVTIESIGDALTWEIDGLLIATVDLSTVNLGGGNIFFGHSDTNSTSSTDVNDMALLFTLIDNIEVVQVPTPGIPAVLGLGAVMFRRRR